MILNNYWRYMYSVENTYYKIGEGNFHIYTGCKDINGGEIEIGGGTPGNAYKLGDNFALRSNLGARVGTGNTEPTVSDYELEADITGNISNLEVSTITSTTDNSYKTIISISGKNNTTNEITLREVGITKNIRNVNNADNFQVPVLFVRHILDEEISVPSGGNFAFVFEWIEA